MKENNKIKIKKKENLHISVVKPLDSDKWVISEKLAEVHEVEEAWELEFWVESMFCQMQDPKFPSKIEVRSELQLGKEMKTIKARSVW